MGSLHVVNHASKSIVTVAACAALAISAAGCGEKEEPATTGPVVTQTTTTTTSANGGGNPKVPVLQARILVRQFLQSPSAGSICGAKLTPGFLRRTYGNRQKCIAQRKPATLARSVTILNVVGGKAPKAQARPTGGAYDGERLQFTMRFSGSNLQIDGLSSNAKGGKTG